MGEANLGQNFSGGMGTDDLDFWPFLAVPFADEFEGSDRK